MCKAAAQRRRPDQAQFGLQIKRRAASSLGSLGQYILAGRSYALPGLFLTQVASARVFWPAEAYHQRYLQKGGQNADKECEVAVRCYG